MTYGGMPTVGIEPTATVLRAPRSTAELSGLVVDHGRRTPLYRALFLPYSHLWRGRAPRRPGRVPIQMPTRRRPGARAAGAGRRRVIIEPRTRGQAYPCVAKLSNPVFLTSEVAGVERCGFGMFGLPAGSPAWSSICLLYTSPSPRDQRGSRMPSSA